MYFEIPLRNDKVITMSLMQPTVLFGDTVYNVVHTDILFVSGMSHSINNKRNIQTKNTNTHKKDLST